MSAGEAGPEAWPCSAGIGVLARRRRRAVLRPDASPAGPRPRLRSSLSSPLPGLWLLVTWPEPAENTPPVKSSESQASGERGRGRIGTRH